MAAWLRSDDRESALCLADGVVDRRQCAAHIDVHPGGEQAWVVAPLARLLDVPHFLARAFDGSSAPGHHRHEIHGRIGRVEVGALVGDDPRPRRSPSWPLRPCGP